MSGSCNIGTGDRGGSAGIENAYWSALDDIGRRERLPPHLLCTFISDRDPRDSLASAIRVFVARYFRELASGGAEAPPGDDDAELHEMPERVRRARFATEARDYVLCHDVELDRIDDAHPGIAFLFAYWRALTRGADRARYGDFRLDTLKAIGFDANIHLMDVQAPDPNEFRIIRMAPATVLHRANDDVPLRALGDTLYVREIKADYAAVKRRGQPILQHLSVRTAEGALRYQRLILPCAIDDDRIDRLIVGVAPLSGIPARWRD